jgi:hypothetical protein
VKSVDKRVLLGRLGGFCGVGFSRASLIRPNPFNPSDADCELYIHLQRRRSCNENVKQFELVNTGKGFPCIEREDLGGKKGRRSLKLEAWGDGHGREAKRDA